MTVAQLRNCEGIVRASATDLWVATCESFGLDPDTVTKYGADAAAQKDPHFRMLDEVARELRIQADRIEGDVNVLLREARDDAQ